VRRALAAFGVPMRPPVAPQPSHPGSRREVNQYLLQALQIEPVGVLCVRCAWIAHGPSFNGTADLSKRQGWITGRV
jgi:hypothetical protein